MTDDGRRPVTPTLPRTPLQTQGWALITGASRGIGRACASMLAAAELPLVLSGRDRQALADLQAHLVGDGATVEVIPADLSRRSGVTTLTGTVADLRLQIDVLINNAGIGSSADPRPLTEFSDETWDRTMHLNLTVPYLLTKALLPSMVERGFGRVVNVASIVGKVGFCNGSAYAASKHGLLGLTRSVAAEVATKGVTVNAVCPGPTATDMNDRRIAFEAAEAGLDAAEMERRSTPIGRRVAPLEVAAMVAYLVSRDAAAVTGQAFNIDGGLVTH